MSLDYFYNLTARQLTNIVNGSRKKEDLLSQERWIIAREMMYVFLVPNTNQPISKTDIITFPWEKEMIENTVQKNKEDFLQEIEEVKLFWEQQDKKENSL